MRVKRGRLKEEERESEKTCREETRERVRKDAEREREREKSFVFHSIQMMMIAVLPKTGKRE